MPRKRTDVEKIREVLRLNLELKFSIRKTAEAVGISKTSVGEYIAEFKRSGLTYRDILKMEDKDIVEIFEKGNRTSNPLYEALSKEFPQYQRELSRVGVTLYLLWEEYKSKYPDGFSYSRFCHYYRMWESKLNPSMHIEHKAGDLIYADFTGKKMHYYDIETGEVHEVEVFISVLGASQLIYTEALDSQKLKDWIWVNENSWWYYGGVTNGICPDNLKSAVTKACNYEPLLNETYHDLARHYNTVILPTRPVKPKDKSLVENAVRIVYQRIFAVLRNQKFFSLRELNEAIWKELEKVNNAPFQRRDISRRELFNEIEKDALKPLPAERYEIKQYQVSKVEYNHHIYLKEDRHYYSVPFQYTGRKVKTKYTSRMVEIFKDGVCVAVHPRDRKKYGYTTETSHMPASHQFVEGWNTDRFVKWASGIGGSVETFINLLLESKEHPQQAFKSCMGVLQLGKKYDPADLEKVCHRAIEFNHISYRFLENALKNNVHKLEEEETDEKKIPPHDNIRGKDHYQ
ncbi:MAG TPA: IS21 family transposase [Deltaproteobacteria bacterium]|nr:MAG: IS21 family transposase [Bacteroidota bacterium]HDH98080.1 IS21 family transposase [Deltaproteobacteria bacterium]